MAHTLHAEMWLPLPTEQVFAFFGNVANLDALTPPSLHFKTLAPDGLVLRAGTVLEHRLRMFGIPIRWQSELTVWNPPHQFVDEQRRGLYKTWKHRHDFLAHNGGTLICDHIEYRARGWFLEPLVHRWIVAPKLRAVFEHRHKRTRELLAPQSTGADDKIVFL